MFVSLALLAAPTALAEGPSAGADAARVLEDLQLSHTVTLTSPGAEPRRVVGFAPKPGASASYELVTTQHMDLSMTGPDGQVMDMSAMMGGMSPTIIMTMTNRVGQPVADDLVPVQITLGDTRVEGVQPQMAEQIASSMAPMKDLGYRMLVEPDGDVAQVDVSIDDPQMFQALQSMADQSLTQLPTFPDEPIGVGATWTVDLDMSMSGLELATTQTLEVVALTDDTITMKTRFVMKRGDAPLQLPGMPPGADVDITRFDGSGAGQLTTDLTTMASTGEMTFDLDMSMSMKESGSAPMVMDMDMTQTTRMRPTE